MGAIRATTTRGASRTASRGTQSGRRAAPSQRNEPPSVGAHTDADEMLHLQATIGNRAVQRLLATSVWLQREGDDLEESTSSVGGGTGTAVALPPDPNVKLRQTHQLPPDPNKKLKQPGQLPPDPNLKLKQPLPPDPNLKLKQPGQLPPDPNLKLQGGQPAAPAPDFGAAVQQIRKTRGLLNTSMKAAVTKRNQAQQYYIAGKAHWNLESQDSGVQAATAAANATQAAKGARDELRDKATWLADFDAAHGLLMKAPVKTRTKSWNDIEYAGKAAEKVRPLDAATAAAANWARKAHEPLQLPKSGPTGIIGILQQKLNKTRATGPRLPVTGVFTTETDTALRAFQTAASVTVNGVADVPTWVALNKKAPSHVVTNDLIVDSKEGAKATKPLNGKIHTELKKGDRGAGVREMQQRLNNWINPWAGPGTPPYKAFRANGYFSTTDRKALQAFQKGHGLPESGVANQATWVQLDGVGSVTTGNRDFDWQENVEGVSGVGTTAKYDWEVKGDAITITVKIKFTGRKTHPMVNTWLKDITSVWNDYKAVEVGKANPREYKIQFVPEKSASGWHQVEVKKPKPGESDRSNSSEWYVTDNDRGLAPHEFGHLVGLEDEYNRPEEEAVRVSGQEPTLGALRSASGKTPKQIATELHTVVTATVGKTKAKRIRKIAAKVTQHGLQPGAFARAVEQEYKAAWGFAGAPNLSNYFGVIAGDQFQDDLSTAAAPFVVSNQSLMGEMQTVGNRKTDLSKLPPHQHPVQPRHVRTFANLIALTFPGTKWEPKRR
jgi:peptidoglycan hydrolase-like protein with peptidoglycan-binding domain